MLDPLFSKCHICFPLPLPVKCGWLRVSLRSEALLLCVFGKGPLKGRNPVAAGILHLRVGDSRMDHGAGLGRAGPQTPHPSHPTRDLPVWPDMGQRTTMGPTQVPGVQLVLEVVTSRHFPLFPLGCFQKDSREERSSGSNVWALQSRQSWAQILTL
jgi:hypothetical protein